MAVIKEVYIISLDIPEELEDATVLSVAEWDNNHFKYVNQITGQEAKELYEKLILKGENKDERNS